jgi:hypothetical protein
MKTVESSAVFQTKQWAKKEAGKTIENRTQPETCVQSGVKIDHCSRCPLLHVCGYAAPETRAAVERARLLIEQAEALGEPPEDPVLLFSVLYGFWVANLVAFNGDVMRELAVQFLVYCSPVLRHPAGLIQAANFRSAIAF